MKQFDKCIAKEETNPNYILKFIIEQLHNEVKDKINEENSTIIVYDKSNMMQVIDKEIDSFKKKNNTVKHAQIPPKNYRAVKIFWRGGLKNS